MMTEIVATPHMLKCYTTARYDRLYNEDGTMTITAA